jgi:DUF4097 and DUF4098 domain-containing protein YvlB
MNGRRVGGFAVWAAILGAALSTACTVNVNTEGATASETHTFEVSGTPDVTLETFDGGIEVHTWDRPTIEVIVEKQAPDENLLQQIKVEPTQDGNKVAVRVRGPEHSHDGGIHIGVVFSPSAKLRVALPRTSTLDVRSSDGNLNVEDVSGTMSLRTSDGAIIGLRLTGDIRARTDDGSVRLREATGKVDVETLDGSVVVNGTLTHLRAKSGDGSVRVAAESGSVLTEDWLIETGDGSVDVRLPEGLDAEVDASTQDGTIRSTYRGLDVPRREATDRRKDGRQLRVTLGGGGKTLRVRTGDGTIRFES